MHRKEAKKLRTYTFKAAESVSSNQNQASKGQIVVNPIGLVSFQNHLLLYRDFSLHLIISNRKKRLRMLLGIVKGEYLTWLCLENISIHTCCSHLVDSKNFEPELHPAEHEAGYRPSPQG